MEVAKAIIMGLAMRGGIIMGLATLFLFLIVLVWLSIRILKKSKIKKN